MNTHSRNSLIQNSFPAIFIKSDRVVEIRSEYLIVDGLRISLDSILIREVVAILNSLGVSAKASTVKILNYPAILLQDFSSSVVMAISGNSKIINKKNLVHPFLANSIDGEAIVSVLLGAHKEIEDLILVDESESEMLILSTINNYSIFIGSRKYILPDYENIDSKIKQILAMPNETTLCK